MNRTREFLVHDLVESARLAEAIARCEWEIEKAEAALRAGHPDVAGLCIALSDWSTELRMLENELAGLRCQHVDPWSGARRGAP